MPQGDSSQLGIILVSHSRKITDGLQEMIHEMTSDSVKVISSGGTDEGRLGTSATLIMENIESCKECKHILLFCDLGSSILSSETAIELVEEELQEKCVIVDAPLVEGAFVGAVQSMVTDDLKAILKEVDQLKNA